MKTKLLLSFLALVTVSNAAVTLGFSTGTNVAEGWANSSGSQNSTMVWGIIVDAAGDGFDGFGSATTQTVDGGTLFTSGATYDTGFSLIGTSGAGAIAGGQLLSIGGAPSDDRIYISSNLMAVVASEGRITQLASMTYPGDIAAGDTYAIVWFDATTLGGSASGNYGAWTKAGLTPSTGTILPADPGSYTTATGPAGNFGLDETATTKVAGLTLVPEPSVTLLGAVGALALLRRRRN